MARGGERRDSDLHAARPWGQAGRVIRWAGDEFCLEAAVDDPAVAALDAALGNPPAGVYPVLHQEATLLLAGSRSGDVLAQVCGIDFDQLAAETICFTRMAAVSCAILREADPSQPVYRIVVEPSFAQYLWDTLAEMVDEIS